MRLRFGNICNIDGFRARVELPDEDYIKTDWLPVLVSNSLSNQENNPVDIQTPVAVLLDESGQDGVILGAIYTDSNPPVIVDSAKKYYRFKDGSHFEFDPNTSKFTADIKGEGYIKCTKMTHEGDINVIGNIIATKEVSDKKGTMQAIRDTYNGHTNPNGGVVKEKME